MNIDDEIFVEGTGHAIDRRRSRSRVYYICPCCSNQFLYNRPKKRICPVCYTEELAYVNNIDEFEEKAIDLYSDNQVLKAYKDDFKYICRGLTNLLMSMLPGEFNQQKAAQIRANINRRAI